ncbi:hypothetical protein PG984_016622 [Apiospora sp. TS-2023a]
MLLPMDVCRQIRWKLVCQEIQWKHVYGRGQGTPPRLVVTLPEWDMSEYCDLTWELLYDTRANTLETALSWELAKPIVKSESERRAKDGSYKNPPLDVEDVGEFVAACFWRLTS